jgi:hypothetical protein
MYEHLFKIKGTNKNSAGKIDFARRKFVVARWL